VELITFLIIGAFAGFAAGLFGVGGGTIIVPLLYIVFSQMGYSPDVIMHLALGTSLATIVVTSISSLMAHNKNGAVIWPVFKNLAPPMAIGCFAGAGIAGWLSGLHLQMIVGVFLLWVAYTMFMGAKKPVDPTKHYHLQLNKLSRFGYRRCIGHLRDWRRQYYGAVFNGKWRGDAKSGRDVCRLRFTHCHCWCIRLLCSLACNSKLKFQIPLALFISMPFWALV
jgi:Predicted permeases